MDVKNDSENTKSDIKEITFLPNFTKLLSPTTELLGYELRNFVKERIDTLKEKNRAENIVGHISRIQSRIDDEEIPASIDSQNIQQLDLFNDWVEVAQDISPDDSQIAKLWQEMLITIARTGNHTHSKLLLEKLRQLNPQEATLLLEIKHKREINSSGFYSKDEKEFYYLCCMEKNDLLTRSNIRFVMRSSFYFWMVIFGFLIFAILIFEVPLDEIVETIVYKYESLHREDLLFFSFILFSLILMLVGFLKLSTTNIRIFPIKKFFVSCKRLLITWELTWIGEELVGYAKELKTRKK